MKFLSSLNMIQLTDISTLLRPFPCLLCRKCKHVRRVAKIIKLTTSEGRIPSISPGDIMRHEAIYED
jgi:hypothetical protein